MKSFIQALKENAKKPVVFTPEPRPQEDIDYEEAMKMYGVEDVSRFSLQEKDEAYEFFEKAYLDGKINKLTFSSICNVMLGMDLNVVINGCKHGKDIWFVADEIFPERK